MPKVPMNYQNAVIYKIVPNDLNNESCYIGSTTNFNKRKSDHKDNLKAENKANYPIYKCIRENGGWNAWDMILIENYPCNNKNELHARERHFIEELKSNLNKVIPTRTLQEYNIDNKERLNKISREYHEKHKDVQNQKNKNNYEKNKVQVRAKMNEVIICECGKNYTYGNRHRHWKSKIHLARIDVEDNVDVEDV